MTRSLSRFLRDDDGQDLIEYALLATLISLAAITAVTALGSTLFSRYGNIANTVAS
jgi:pilus assembly protein Flp/PilA